jgi:hypothetical protein
LASYQKRRVGLSTTTDRKNVAWGVVAFAPIFGGGIAGGGGESTMSLHRRLLRVDGSGAVYPTDREFLVRMEGGEWWSKYSAGIERERGLAGKKVSAELKKAATITAIVGAALILPGALMGALGDDIPGPDVNGPGWAIVTAGATFLLPVSITLGATAKQRRLRAERSIPDELPGDILVGHVEAYNQWTAGKLDVVPQSVGESIKAPTVEDAIERALELGELAREDE